MSAPPPETVPASTTALRGPITREALLDGSLALMLRQAGLGELLWSDERLSASLEATLACQPAGIREVWLFAYGSLIWNPAICFEERRPALLLGWHRRFAHATPVGRGTPERPGLVLSLDRGGACRGVAYRLASERARHELRLVWAREMPIGSYRPHWGCVRLTDGRRLTALAFVAETTHPLYERAVPHAALVERLATAFGELGPNAEYLLQTVDGLKSHGIRDRCLDRLARDVRARLASPGA